MGPSGSLTSVIGSPDISFRSLRLIRRMRLLLATIMYGALCVCVCVCVCVCECECVSDCVCACLVFLVEIAINIIALILPKKVLRFCNTDCVN